MEDLSEEALGAEALAPEVGAEAGPRAEEEDGEEV